MAMRRLLLWLSLVLCLAAAFWSMGRGDTPWVMFWMIFAKLDLILLTLSKRQ